MINLITAAPDARRLYDDAVAIGTVMAADMDVRRWGLGDLAASLKPVYGGNIVGLFAVDIHMVKKTLQSYERVASYYDDKSLRRSQFIEANPMLIWTHYRDAVRLGDVEASYDFLGLASERGWTAEQAGIELAIKAGNGTARIKLFEFEERAFLDMFYVPEGFQSLLQPGKIYHVAVYEDKTGEK
jgi:hypothetical protein